MLSPLLLLCVWLSVCFKAYQCEAVRGEAMDALVTGDLKSSAGILHPLFDVSTGLECLFLQCGSPTYFILECMNH